MTAIGVKRIEQLVYFILRAQRTTVIVDRGAGLENVLGNSAKEIPITSRCGGEPFAVKQSIKVELAHPHFSLPHYQVRLLIRSPTWAQAGR
jgi:hypothetical protein